MNSDILESIDPRSESGKIDYARTALLLGAGAAISYRTPENSTKSMETMDTMHQKILLMVTAHGKIRIDKIAASVLMSRFGFMPMDTDPSLALIPLWLYPYVDDACVIRDIHGRMGTFAEAKHLNHTQFGMLPYGVCSVCNAKSLAIETHRQNLNFLPYTDSHD